MTEIGLKIVMLCMLIIVVCGTGTLLLLFYNLIKAMIKDFKD